MPGDEGKNWGQVVASGADGRRVGENETSNCGATENSGFAWGGEWPIVPGMENPAQALEDARRAGIDLDLLDTNLALTYEERVLRHESALELASALREAGAAYEKSARAAAEIR